MNEHARAWLARAIAPDATIGAIEPLPGSTSATLYRVDATAAGRPASFVLRVFTNRSWLATEPDLAAHEAAVLRAVEDLEPPAPRLVAFTQDSATFGAPAVVMTRLEGRVHLTPEDLGCWLGSLTETLASIHGLAPRPLRWRFSSWTDAARLAVPAWATRPGLWRDAIERWGRRPAGGSATLLHRDFHPTNLLWRDGRVAGVVDWVNGCIGPAGVDVAHCALNLALMFGAVVAEAFVASYAAKAGEPEDLAYWQIDAILGALPTPTYYAPWTHFGLGDIPRRTLCARLEDHLERVLERD